MVLPGTSPHWLDHIHTRYEHLAQHPHRLRSLASIGTDLFASSTTTSRREWALLELFDHPDPGALHLLTSFAETPLATGRLHFVVCLGLRHRRRGAPRPRSAPRTACSSEGAVGLS
jgi:hypothetical protein